MNTNKLDLLITSIECNKWVEKSGLISVTFEKVFLSAKYNILFEISIFKIFFFLKIQITCQYNMQIFDLKFNTKLNT